MDIQKYLLYIFKKFFDIFDSYFTLKSNNVGINQANPAAKLHVTGTIRANRLEVYDVDDTTLREFVDSNGFHAIRYRDEYVGGEWVDALGGAAPDLVNVTIGGVATRMQAYDGANTEERKSNSFENAHDLAYDLINAGTVKIEWHVHAMASTNNAGVAKFFLDYCYIPANSAPIPQTPISCLVNISANQQYFHKIAGAELPVPAGGFGIGDIILFNLRRTPTDSQDTYPYDILLIKTALHVPTDDFGSRQRYIK